MLRCLVPFTERYQPTVDAAPDGAVWVDVSGDPHDYWRTMCDWWAAGETFMVIDQDNDLSGGVRPGDEVAFGSGSRTMLEGSCWK